MPTLNRRRENNNTSHKQGSNFRWFYQSARWHRLSKQIRKERPLCEIALKQGRTERSEVVDHIIPLVIWVTQMGRDPYDITNLQAISKSAHSIKTKQERKQLN